MSIKILGKIFYQSKIYQNAQLGEDEVGEDEGNLSSALRFG